MRLFKSDEPWNIQRANHNSKSHKLLNSSGEQKLENKEIAKKGDC